MRIFGILCILLVCLALMGYLLTPKNTNPWNGLTTGTGENYWCYQESANSVNQTGIDGNCGLNYSGSYSYPGTGPGAPSEGYVQINYTKPATALSTSKWQVKHGDLTTYNITIPTDCWNAYPNSLVFRLVSHISYFGGTAYSKPQCYNGATWEDIGATSSGTTNQLNSTTVTYIPTRVYDGNWLNYYAWVYFSSAGYWGYGFTEHTPSGNINKPNLYEEAMWWNMPIFGCIGATQFFACGDTINQNCTLNSNLTGTTSCFLTNTSNIAIDCAGYAINGSNATDSYGFKFQGASNETLQNCQISNFHYGLFLNDTNLTTVSNISVSSNRIDFQSNGSSENNQLINVSLGGRNISFAYNGSISLNFASSPAPDPTNYSNISCYYNITNESTAWINFNFSYLPSDVVSLYEANMRIWRYDGSAWSVVPSPNSVDTTAHIISANITNFSIFAPMGPMGSANSSASFSPGITKLRCYPPSPINYSWTDWPCTGQGSYGVFNITNNHPFYPAIVSMKINIVPPYTLSCSLGAGGTNYSISTDYAVLGNVSAGVSDYIFCYTSGNVVPPITIKQFIATIKVD